MILSKHAMFIDELYNLWGIGDNSYGQLGYPTVEGIFHSTAVKVLNEIRQVATGYSHTAVLTKDNKVMCMGLNDKGQLGAGLNSSKQSSDVPEYVDFGEDVIIVQVECGLNHTIALDSDGNVWLWGDNKYMQCGVHHVYSVTQTGSQQSKPIKLDPTTFNKYSELLAYDPANISNRGIVIDGNIYEIGAGNDYSLLRINNFVWVWGNNSDYVMTNNGPSICTEIPILINEYFTSSYDLTEPRNKIVTAIAGDRFISLLNEESDVLFCGKYLINTIDGYKQVNTVKFTVIADEVVLLHYSPNSILMTRNTKDDIYVHSMEIKLMYLEDQLYLLNKLSVDKEFTINVDFYIYDFSAGIKNEIYVKGWKYLGTTNNTYISNVNALIGRV